MIRSHCILLFSIHGGRYTWIHFRVSEQNDSFQADFSRTLVSGKRSRGSPPSKLAINFLKSQHALANIFSKTVEMGLLMALNYSGSTLFEPKIARQLRERFRNSRLDLIYLFFSKNKIKII